MFTYVILVHFLGFIDKMWRRGWDLIVLLEKCGEKIHVVVLKDSSFQSTKNLTRNVRSSFLYFIMNFIMHSSHDDV